MRVLAVNSDQFAFFRINFWDVVRFSGVEVEIRIGQCPSFSNSNVLQ